MSVPVPVVVGFALFVGALFTVGVRVPVIVLLIGVPVPVPVFAVGASFRLKRCLHGGDNQVHGAQHVCEYMVRFYVQVGWGEFNRYVTIA